VCKRNHEGVFNDPMWAVELMAISTSTIGATFKGKIGYGSGSSIMGAGGSLPSSSSLQYIMGDFSKPHKDGKKIYESISGYTEMIDKGLEKFDKGAKTKIPSPDKFKDVKAFTSLLPYVGYAVGIIDFFVSGGSKNKSSDKAVTPLARSLDAVIEGTISIELPASKFDIAVPGTELPLEGRLNPLSYNYPLGVLNLMDTPVLEYVDYQYDIELSPGICEGGLRYGDEFMRQYHLKAPLQFAMNPMAGLKIKSLEAEIVYTLGTSRWGVTADTSQMMNILAPGDPLGSYYPIMLYGPAQFRMPTDYTGSFPNQLAEGGITINGWARASATAPRGRNAMSSIYFSTGYMQPSCLENQSIVLGIDRIHSPAWRYNPSFALRVQAIFERTDADENTEDVVFINTYQVKLEAHPTSTSSANRYGYTSRPCIFRPTPPSTDPGMSSRYRRDFVLGQMRSALNPSGPAFPLGILAPDRPRIIQGDVRIWPGTYFDAETTIVATGRIVVESAETAPGVNVTLVAPEIIMYSVGEPVPGIFRPGFRAISGSDAIERIIYGSCADASPYANVLSNTALTARCSDSLNYTRESRVPV
jgi:hypothetical protein